MKFDIFYQLPEAANQITTERYRELIAEAAEADRLGFNTVWLAEVHFAPRFSVMPTPLMLLAAIAERTTNIRLGMAVNLMPLHHPIRLAEEIATLDVLSGGRVEFGAGRGAFPLNYRGYGVEMADSRQLFEDGLAAVKAAWTEKRADGVEVVPKPIQRPHPPIRLAANSADTFTFAGANRYPIFAGGPVNPIPVLAERLKIYESALKDAGHERPDDWLAAALMVFVGRDRAQVRATIEPSLRNYFNAVSEIIEPESLAAGAQAEFQKVRNRLRTIDYSDRRFNHGNFRRPRILHRPNRATEGAIRFLAISLLVRNRRHQRPSKRARRDAPVRRPRDAEISSDCGVTDEDLVLSLLDYLRAVTACPALAYAEAPTRMSGGYDATILRFSLHSAPDPLSGPLVLRLFQANVDAQRAPREAAVQNALAELGYPAPRVFVTEARIEALGGPFIIMERVPGLPLGSEFEGLRIKGLRQAFDTLRQLPRVRREMLRLWDEAQTRLQALPVQISSIGSRGPASLARLLPSMLISPACVPPPKSSVSKDFVPLLTGSFSIGRAGHKMR